jgi:hypothetical protein
VSGIVTSRVRRALMVSCVVGKCEAPVQQVQRDFYLVLKISWSFGAVR